MKVCEDCASYSQLGENEDEVSFFLEGKNQLFMV